MGVASTHVEMVDSTVIVLPGDAIHLPTPSTRLGPGTAVSGNSKDAYVSKPGILRRKGEESVWVQSQQKRVSKPHPVIIDNLLSSMYLMKGRECWVWSQELVEYTNLILERVT